MLERRTHAFHESPHMRRRFTLYNQSADVGYIDDGLRSKKPVNKIWAIITVEMFKTTGLLVWSSRNLVLLINGRDYFFVGKVIIEPPIHYELFQRAVEQACKMAQAWKGRGSHCNANERWESQNCAKCLPNLRRHSCPYNEHHSQMSQCRQGGQQRGQLRNRLPPWRTTVNAQLADAESDLR